MTGRRARAMESSSIWRSRSRWAGRIVLGAGAIALSMLAQLGACERHADIRDERDAAPVLDQDPQLDAGELPTLDSGLGTDAYPSCDDRAEGECRGSNDFPCAFREWIGQVAESCQRSTSCNTNGWLQVKMGADGCVVEIAMDEPNADITACLLEELGNRRCPCGEDDIRHFFGLGNKGDCDAGAPPG